MSGDEWASEDRLSQEVVSVIRRSEPVPAGVVAAARAAYAWRSIVAAIADLEFDSAVDDDDLARVRDAGSERRLRFRGGGRVTELSVIDGGARVVGRIDPPLVGQMVLCRPGAEDVASSVDRLGQFMFENLRAGVVSIRSLPDDPAEPGFHTDWVAI